MNEPFLINPPIDIQDGSLHCTTQCELHIEYTKRYVIPSNDGLILAIIPIKEYSDADIFFNTAFGKSTRAQYRQIYRDGYICRTMIKEERNCRLDELFAINTSVS